MSISTVLFDLDGTLLDTLADLAQAANGVLADHGLPPNATGDYRMMVGFGARNLMRQAFAKAAGLPAEEVRDLDHLQEAFAAKYASGWHEKTQPYPGITEMLEDFCSAGIAMAVLSNKPDPFVQEMVRYFFRPELFAVMAGQQEGWPLKPDPALALDICRRLGSKPQETALIGDSGSDMATAVRSGMWPLGVRWGFRSAAELNENGARILFANAAELDRFIRCNKKAGGF